MLNRVDRNSYFLWPEAGERQEGRCQADDGTDETEIIYDNLTEMGPLAPFLFIFASN